MSIDFFNTVCLSGTAGVMFLSALLIFLRWRKEAWIGFSLVVAGLLLLFASFAQNSAMLVRPASENAYDMMDRESDLFRGAGLGLVFLITFVAALRVERQKNTQPLAPSAIFAARLNIVVTGLMAFWQLARAFDAYRFLQSMSWPIGYFP